MLLAVGSTFKKFAFLCWRHHRRHSCLELGPSRDNFLYLPKESEVSHGSLPLCISWFARATIHNLLNCRKLTSCRMYKATKKSVQSPLPCFPERLGTPVVLAGYIGQFSYEIIQIELASV